MAIFSALVSACAAERANPTGIDAAARDRGSSDDATPADRGGVADGGASVDAEPADAAPNLDAESAPDAPAKSDGGSVRSGAVSFGLNGPRDHEYGLERDLPLGFGVGEWTLQLFVRLDASFPVGPTNSGDDQLRNWADADLAPYSSGDWWYQGNFLLDGHNNSSFSAGTFSLQFYGGGRLRWLVGDGAVPWPGAVWSAGVYPATGTPSLLDGAWHGVAVVRRFVGAATRLELWIDGRRLADVQVDERLDLRATYWDWSSFPPNQEGWFWGAEKQAAIGAISQYEDYKGALADLRYYDVALAPAQLADWDRAITGNEPGLVGWVPFDEGSGDRACDARDRTRCMVFMPRGRVPWVPGPALR